MGDPQKLYCRICGDMFYLHPANEKPIVDSDLCPTCETFQLGLAAFYEEPLPEKKNPVLGRLILALTALSTLTLIVWLVRNSLR